MPDELNVITSRPDTQTAMPSHCDNANCVSLPLLRRSRCQCLNMPKWTGAAADPSRHMKQLSQVRRSQEKFRQLQQHRWTSSWPRT